MSDFVEVETIKEVVLCTKESTVIPIALKSTRPANLIVTDAVYDFLSLLPTKESLARRGRRLYDTPLQRQTRTYAPDTFMDVAVFPSDHRLTVKFVNDEDFKLIQGENLTLQISFLNSGSIPISEIWMVACAEDNVWMRSENGFLECEFQHSVVQRVPNDLLAPAEGSVISSNNTLKPRLPQRLQGKHFNEPLQLQAGESTELTVILHAESSGAHELSLMFVFRKV